MISKFNMRQDVNGLMDFAHPPRSELDGAHYLSDGCQALLMGCIDELSVQISYLQAFKQSMSIWLRIIRFPCSNSQAELYPQCLSSPVRMQRALPSVMTVQATFGLLDLWSNLDCPIPLPSVSPLTTSGPSESTTPPSSPPTPFPSPVSNPSPHPVERNPLYIPPCCCMSRSMMVCVILVRISILDFWLALFFQTGSPIIERKALSCWENQENQKQYAWQTAKPWDPQRCLGMQVKRFWQWRQAEYGMVTVQEAFQRCLPFWCPTFGCPSLH